MSPAGPIKALVIQSKPTLWRRLAYLLARHPEVRIGNWAADAWEARLAVIEHHPDVILLDVGLSDWATLLRSLLQYYPVPVIAIGQNGPQSRTRVLRAMARGAMDFITEPEAEDAPAWKKLADELAQKLHVASHDFRPVSPARLAAWRATSFAEGGLDPRHFVVGVGASTGGPEALRIMLTNAPPDFPPVLIVQHMPAMFTASFAERLNRYSAMSVAEARQGDVLSPGRALVARGDTHLTARRIGQSCRVCYSHQRPIGRYCPSVDVLFESLLPFGERAVGVLLTGMGDDGARGLLRLRQAGALTLAQNRESCAVYGMPKVATETGAAELTAAPADIPELIRRTLAARTGVRAAAGGARK